MVSIKVFYYVCSFINEGVYEGDFFVFPMSKFRQLIKYGIKTNTKRGQNVKLYLSREIVGKKWYSRRLSTRNDYMNGLTNKNVIEITDYHRNLGLLK